MALYDELQSPERQAEKTMKFSECTSLGATLDFGRGTMSLEEEVRACLLFFNRLGFVMYFDEEALRDLVILNPVGFLIGPITKVFSWLRQTHLQMKCG
jgi:chromosome condensin MukBEF MukE localization factor